MSTFQSTAPLTKTEALQLAATLIGPALAEQKDTDTVKYLFDLAALIAKEDESRI